MLICLRVPLDRGSDLGQGSRCLQSHTCPLLDLAEHLASVRDSVIICGAATMRFEDRVALCLVGSGEGQASLAPTVRCAPDWIPTESRPVSIGWGNCFVPEQTGELRLHETLLFCPRGCSRYYLRSKHRAPRVRLQPCSAAAPVNDGQCGSALSASRPYQPLRQIP